MPIRSIDYQVMIPKTSEIQKIKHAETQNALNNNNINLHKQQEQNERNLKKVNETKKAFESRINRDQKKKQQQGSEQEEEQKNKKKKQEDKPTIDIRI